MKIRMTLGCRKGLMALAFAKAILITTSCKTENYTAQKLSASQTQINSTINGVASIQSFIAPYKESLDEQMGTPLSYNPTDMTKTDTPLNTRIGNMMAAIARTQGAPIFKSRTGKEIDMVLLNHGGIRAGIPAGYVTTRTAYEVMPFENEMVVAELAPEQMKELTDYLVEKQRAHPFDALKITTADADVELSLEGQPITFDRNYYILTNDYLMTGGDNMEFFKKAVSSTVLDYKIRNAMIDYFTKTDTLGFQADDRFTKTN
ncbi:5'-nucleotidase C-terminal domain-containing protein [Nonlabens sp. Hel1_33_55]|uniref:5'-nucleotidase C-terminal domain-containing protein n=1 Tax=Nonlabens sp. Hel1_33_55 TaxID=1336802 RepID=UPI000B807952|nr:5'-nucleotidase [Nonlabens sp. Hel1_33_55]